MASVTRRQGIVYQSTKEDHDFHDMLDQQDDLLLQYYSKFDKVVTIAGSGPTALANMFRHIAEHGIDNILKMGRAEFSHTFVDIECENPEVLYIGQELYLIRNPTYDIETAYEKYLTSAEVYWTSIHCGKVFTPRLMSEFTGSKYYEIFAAGDEEPSAEDIVRAWFEDLRNGINVVCRDVVISHFDEYHAKTEGREFAKFFAEFIRDKNLTTEFARIPKCMLREAKLRKTRWILDN